MIGKEKWRRKMQKEKKEMEREAHLGRTAPLGNFIGNSGYDFFIDGKLITHPKITKLDCMVFTWVPHYWMEPTDNLFKRMAFSFNTNVKTILASINRLKENGFIEVKVEKKQTIWRQKDLSNKGLYGTEEE